MKVNIEIQDDSKFLEALAEEMNKPKQPTEGAEGKDFELNRVSPQSKFSCVAVSCNG